MSTSMDAILKGEATPPEEKPEVEETKDAKPEGGQEADKGESEGDTKTGDDPGEDPAKGENKATPPAAEKMVPLEATLDERDRRKEAELRANTAERKLAELTQSEETPDFNEDPQSAFAHFQKTADEKANTRFVNMSVEVARSAHDDFDEVMGTYKELVTANPSLHHEALAASHPGEFAYQAALRHKQLSEVGDIEAFRQKAFEEGKKAALEEAGNPEKPGEKRSSLPESLASERSVGDRRGPQWSGPAPLGEIFAPRKK